MKHAVIIGTGSYVPDNTITNDDMAKLVETSDEWIFSRTGIKQRHISTGENTSDLAYQASKKALEQAGITASELDLIICATITPDSYMPSVACIVQHRLDAVKAVAFDLSAACTGFVYATAVAASFIESGLYNNILVIGAETLSKTLDWSDRSTCVLFGDGAGAAVITASEINTGVNAIRLLSDGSKRDGLVLPGIPLSNPYVNNTEDKAPPYIAMNGQEVFKFAVRSMTDLINDIQKTAGLTQNDIKYVVAHQANFRIIEQAAKALEMPIDKFYINIDKYANTSAATIGIALDEMNRKGLLQQGDKIILIGFGGGMTSGAILMEWELNRIKEDY
jgi:3-oxoacyl-[acyl-carrier-protein] synthase-3